MQACKRLHLIGTLSYSGFRTIFTISNCSVIKQICSGVCIPTHVANIAGIDAMFVIKFHSTSLPATYKSISGVRVLFCAIPSHLVLTFANFFCLPLRRLLCPFPPGSCCLFCLRFQISQQPFLSFISSALPEWFNDHDFRRCGSDNEK